MTWSHLLASLGTLEPNQHPHCSLGKFNPVDYASIYLPIFLIVARKSYEWNALWIVSLNSMRYGFTMISLPTYTPAEKIALCCAYMPFVLGSRGLLGICSTYEETPAIHLCGSEDQKWSLMLPSIVNPAEAALAVKTTPQTHPGTLVSAFQVTLMVGMQWHALIQSWVCRVWHHLWESIPSRETCHRITERFWLEKTSEIESSCQYGH